MVCGDPRFRAPQLEGLVGTETPTGTRLAQLLDHYLPLIEFPESTHAPITITVVSGSAPSMWHSLGLNVCIPHFHR